MLLISLLALTLILSGCAQPTDAGGVDIPLPGGITTSESKTCTGTPSSADVTTVELCQSEVPTTNAKNNCKALLTQDESYCQDFKRSITSSLTEADQQKIFEVTCRAHVQRDPTVCDQIRDLDVDWKSQYESAVMSGYIGACKVSVCDYGVV